MVDGFDNLYVKETVHQVLNKLELILGDYLYSFRDVAEWKSEVAFFADDGVTARTNQGVVSMLRRTSQAEAMLKALMSCSMVDVDDDGMLSVHDSLQQMAQSVADEQSTAAWLLVKDVTNVVWQASDFYNEFTVSDESRTLQWQAGYSSAALAICAP
ncbi:hypothetical protein WJX72_010351 [[Myrmecia] bisecta]|uniref:Uncharacterized protein n=1 Tax=[Myrmecia] bisecta TaxID=41462 RepID=A0AAW1PTR9_9CHLO